MRIRARYTQWAVGQGFFHNGWARADERRHVEVVHVFDCGTQPTFRAALEREIDEFRSRHHRIDLLFISHFHLDHVNGLERLLSSRPARHIIAPLLSPDERLLAFADTLRDGLGPDDWPGWYPGLVADPASALGQLSPDTPITWIKPEPVEVAQAPSLGYYSEGNQIGQVELRLPEPSDGAPSADGRASLCVGDQPVWIWAPWLPEELTEQTSLFRRSLLRLLPSALSDLDDPRTLNEVVVGHQVALKAAYEEVLEALSVGDAGSTKSTGRPKKRKKSHDLNRTSLNMYCGPAVSSSHSWRGKKIDGVVAAERAEVLAWGVHPGWLGTGDGALRSKAAAAQFNAYFRDLKAEVGIFAIPHHGSELSWNTRLLDGFSSPPTCVVGADAYRGWRHPSHEVVQAVNSAGSVVMVATSQEASRWTHVSSTRFGAPAP